MCNRMLSYIPSGVKGGRGSLLITFISSGIKDSVIINVPKLKSLRILGGYFENRIGLFHNIYKVYEKFPRK